MPDPLSDIQWTIVQKVLSCIYRMKGEHPLARVSEVLLGVRTRYIVKTGLNQLSTYGLLAGYDPEELGLLLDALVRAGCAVLSDDGDDIVSITAKGVRVAKKEEPNFTLVWPRKSYETPQSFAQRIAEGCKADMRAMSSRRNRQRPQFVHLTRPEDIALASELRTWRKGVAEELGVPVFRIMTNRTLDAIVVGRPKSLGALRGVFGMYRQVSTEYGEDLLAIIREYQ